MLFNSRGPVGHVVISWVYKSTLWVLDSQRLKVILYIFKNVLGRPTEFSVNEEGLKPTRRDFG